MPHTYGSDSESDSSGEEDDGCHETLGPPPTIACQHNNQKRPNHCQNNQNASAANCLTRVSQTAPREYTQQRESSGARSGPPSPWGTGQTKKRIVNALKNELSDIHLYTGDITTNSCAKVNSPVAMKKRAVRTMVAHGARFSVYQIMLGHKM